MIRRRFRGDRRPASDNDIVSALQDADPALVAVTSDMAADLQRAGLAAPLPVLRGATLNAAMTVGNDAATIIALLQAPEAIRAFAEWLRHRFSRRGDSIKIQGRRHGITVTLQVDGSVPVGTITGFIDDVLSDERVEGHPD